MKKIKFFLLFSIIIIFIPLSGCGKKTNEISYTEQAVRAFGYSDTAKYPLSTICSSRAELNKYLESFNYIYSEDITGQTMLADATAKYDDNFFKSKALILVLVQESSSSITYTANMIFRSGNIITVELLRHVPSMTTADMALWHLIFEVDQKAVHSADEVQVSVTE